MNSKHLIERFELWHVNEFPGVEMVRSDMLHPARFYVNIDVENRWLGYQSAWLDWMAGKIEGERTSEAMRLALKRAEDALFKVPKSDTPRADAACFSTSDPSDRFARMQKELRCLERQLADAQAKFYTAQEKLNAITNHPVNIALRNAVKKAIDPNRLKPEMKIDHISITESWDHPDMYKLHIEINGAAYNCWFDNIKGLIETINDAARFFNGDCL